MVESNFVTSGVNVPKVRQNDLISLNILSNMHYSPLQSICMYRYTQAGLKDTCTASCRPTPVASVQEIELSKGTAHVSRLHSNDTST